MLLATDYNSKNFAVKDSMIIWNEPEHRVDSQSFSNLVRGEGPTCAVTLSSKSNLKKLTLKICRRIL